MHLNIIYGPKFWVYRVVESFKQYYRTVNYYLMSSQVSQFSLGYKYILMDKISSCLIEIFLDRTTLMKSPLKYLSTDKITGPFCSDKFDSATPFPVTCTRYKGNLIPSEQGIKRRSLYNLKNCCSQSPSTFSSSNASKSFKSSK